MQFPIPPIHDLFGYTSPYHDALGIFTPLYLEGTVVIHLFKGNNGKHQYTMTVQATSRGF